MICSFIQYELIPPHVIKCHFTKQSDEISDEEAIADESANRNRQCHRHCKQFIRYNKLIRYHWLKNYLATATPRKPAADLATHTCSHIAGS
jgi:hypothetical protein